MKQFSKVCMVLICFSLIASGMTPQEFDERMDNLNEANLRLNQAPVPLYDYKQKPLPTPTLDAIMPESLQKADGIIRSIKTEYSETYSAQANDDLISSDMHYNQMISQFEELKKYLAPQLALDDLLKLVRSEFGKEPSPTIEIPSVKIDVGTPAEPTVRITKKAPASSSRLVPTIPPEQLRGKKNFLFALADILWENALLIGALLAGILVIYALYSREESESNFG